VVFLHEELMKLPSFPRKALESELDLYKGGEMGKVRLDHIKFANKFFYFMKLGALGLRHAAQIYVGQTDC